MVKIKICGLTNIEDYNNAISFGADYTGFIFYKNSPRYVNKETVSKIISHGIKDYNKKIGVFVNEDSETIKRIFYSAGLDIVQLHGQEDPEYCKKLGIPYWKVIHIKDITSIDIMQQYNCKTFLLDNYSKNKLGGTGESFNLTIAEKAIETGKQIIIAGGVSIENIESILKLTPFGVDINSTIELKSGKKDINRMKQIIDKIKNRD